MIIMNRIISEVLLERLAELEAELADASPVEEELAFVRHLLQLRELAPSNLDLSYQREPNLRLHKQALH